MKNKMLVGFIVAVIVVGTVSFYGGMLYAKSSGEKNLGKNFQNFPALSGQQNAGQMGGEQGKAGIGRGAAAGFVNGDIIAKDDKSITIKSADGGSKIVFLSGNTQITKSVTGALSDLEIEKNVMVAGITNSDGSLTAQSIQLRTDMSALLTATSTPKQ